MENIEVNSVIRFEINNSEHSFMIAASIETLEGKESKVVSSGVICGISIDAINRMWLPETVFKISNNTVSILGYVFEILGFTNGQLLCKLKV